MPDPDSGGRTFTTPAERARLRPTVDVEALERFLAAIPDEVRPGVQHAVLLHFARVVTMADIRDFLSAVGNDEAAAAVDRGIQAGTQNPKARPTNGPDDVSFVSVPPAERIFSMDPPESPYLRALWDAIEPPPRPASG